MNKTLLADHSPDAATSDLRIVPYSIPSLRRPAAAPRPGMPALLADLLAAGSALERDALLRGRLRAIGADWVGHARVAQPPGEPPWLSAFTTQASVAWTSHCLRVGHLLAHADGGEMSASGLPLAWDLEQLEALAGPAAGPAIEGLRAGGGGSGLVFRLPALEPAPAWSFVCLVSRAPHTEWIGEHGLGCAVTLGLCLHEFLLRHVEQPEAPCAAPPPVLLPAQQRILRCLSQGWSNKEIARCLRLSLHAVDYHLRQLRRRFDVHNRTQLVRAALVRHTGNEILDSYLDSSAELPAA
jgi:DNA-binding CsgD family transcriptional regulator